MAVTSNVPPVHDLEIYAGDDFDFSFQIQDAEGAPIPQANVTAIAAQIRDGQTPESTLLATFAGDFSQAAATGTFTISLTSAQTDELPITGGFYDVQVTQNGKKKTRLRGEVSVVEEVTTDA